MEANMRFVLNKQILYIGFFCFFFCFCKGSENLITDTNSLPKQNRIPDAFERPPVALIPIKESVWIHRSHGVVGGKLMASNGLVIRTSLGAVLIDTAWTLAQTEELLQMIQTKWGLGVHFVIITHFHEDRRGGIESFIQRNIPVYTSKHTSSLLEKKGILAKTKSDLNFNNRLVSGTTAIEIYYPGEGHAPDNLVVWLPSTHILFGGCLVKSLDSIDMGNLTDANLSLWPGSLKNLLSRYPDMEVVVPGHGDWGKMDLIRHSLRLLEQTNNP